MAGNKSTTEKKSNWGSLGGNNAMHSFAPTGTQTPGQSSQEGHSGSRRGIAPKAGGPNAGFFSDNSKSGREQSTKAGHNTDYAGVSVAGTTGSTKTGPNEKFAKGGTTHMFGNTGSKTQTAA